MDGWWKKYLNLKFYIFFKLNRNKIIKAIFGDGLGNFIDGLSIGASISQSIGLGLTTALATWFANIPQELGLY